MRSRSSQMLDIIFPLISMIYTDILRIRVHLCYLWESLFPLISLIYTDIPRIRVHLCSSVGGIYLLALRAEIL